MNLVSQHLLFGILFFEGEILHFQCDFSFKYINTIYIIFTKQYVSDTVLSTVYVIYHIIIIRNLHYDYHHFIDA